MVQRRTRKAWKDANAALQETQNYHDWLRALCAVLETPKFAVSVDKKFHPGSGKPVKTVWVASKDSLPISFQLSKNDLSKMTFGNPRIKKDLENLFKFFQSSSRPIIYSTSDWQTKFGRGPVYQIVASLQTIETGGSHNDVSTYDTVLDFRLAFAQYCVL